VPDARLDLAWLHAGKGVLAMKKKKGLSDGEKRSPLKRGGEGRIYSEKTGFGGIGKHDGY